MESKTRPSSPWILTRTRFPWIQKGVIAATISQKPYTMSFVGVKMLDDLYHHKLSTLSNDWAKDSFAPIPSFVDTGSSLVDKTNVDATIAARKTVTSIPSKFSITDKGTLNA